MAAESSFQCLLNDMGNDGVPSIFKRKRLEPPTPALPAKSHRSRESLLLGPVEKRMKSAQWSSSCLFPKAVQVLNPSSIEQRYTNSGRRNFRHINSREAGNSPSNDFEIVDASRLVGGSLNGSANVLGKSIYTSNRGNVRVIPRARSRENDSDLLISAYPHYRRGRSEQIIPAHLQNLQGNGDVYETASRAVARHLKDEESFEEVTELLRGPTLTNAAHGRVNGRCRDTHTEFTRDDTSQASLLDADEHLESPPQWQDLLLKANEKNDRMSARQDEIDSLSATLECLRVSRPTLEKKPAEDPRLVDAFTPLSGDAEHRVNEVLEGFDRNTVLVLHEKSNIEVTTTVMQCLRPQAWLNDEVINVYMELLKEREARAPDFPKCHFFNTFFYNKLYKDKRTYDYRAIRRWTTSRKLGYNLSACDKILVPIHQDIHWCLAVINIRDKRLEYLDSLKGADRDVLEVLARYISDEAKDKDNKVLDTSNWDLEYPRSIPEQQNGALAFQALDMNFNYFLGISISCDCGMFMLKYADFHGRDAPLQFTQEDMPYFRKRTVWEILNLKAT